MTSDRWLPLVGSGNARDLGGLPFAGGGSTACDVLFRTDTPVHWTDYDKTWLREHSLAVVVDLRAPGEAEADGVAQVEGVPVISAPLLRDAVLKQARRRRKKADIAVEEQTPRARRETYVEWLDDDGARNIGRAVSALAITEGAALFHCSAGKDRTGIIAALVLEASGVEQAAIVDDFVASTERVEQIYANLLKSPTHGPNLDGVDPRWLGCHAEAIEGTLDVMHREFGSAREFLVTAGVADGDLELIARRLREG